MSSIISLVVRSLYSLITVFFFVITVQPVVAAGAYDAEIAVLQQCVDGDVANWDAQYSLKKLPEGNVALTSRILALKDAAGNNLAHKLVESGDVGLLAKLLKVCGAAIFEAKNKDGFNSVEANLRSITHILEPIDPKHYYGGFGGDVNQAIEVQKKLRPLALASVSSLVSQYRKYKNELSVAESGRERIESALRAISDYDSSEAKALQSQLDNIWENAHPIRENLGRSAEKLGVFVLSFGIQALQKIIPLEQIDDYNFYHMLVHSEEGRKELRAYRTQAGQTLYGHFNKNANNDGYGIRIKSELLSLYYGAGIPVPTAAEVDITNIGSDWGFANFLETPDGKNFFEKYKNSQGQNLAFIAANDSHLLQKMKDQGVDIEGMLKATDIQGNDGISQIRDAWGYDKIVSESVFESIKIKVQYRREKEQEEQERIWRQGQEEQERLQEEAFAREIKAVNAKPFNDGWWHEVIAHFKLGRNPQEFVSLSLEAILRQNSSPLRSAFLQQNPMDFVSQAQTVNQLWKSFFTTYDDLVRQEEQGRSYRRGRHDDDFDEKMFARPVRVLDIAGRNMRPDQTHATFEIMQTLQSNILAAGGTFGMNFKRTANEDEANIMIESLGSFGDSALRSKAQPFFETLDQAIKGIGEENFEDISDFIASYNNSFTGKVTDKDNMHASIMEYVVKPATLKITGEAANEIVELLFKADSKLTLEQRFKLEDHQTNCAVMALSSVFHRDGSVQIDFAEIDKVLASRPLMRDTSASYYKSSEQRHEEVMQMAGRYHVSDGGDYRSGDDNGSDFGEEY